jgi:hypothetical protein
MIMKIPFYLFYLFYLLDCARCVSWSIIYINNLYLVYESDQTWISLLFPDFFKKFQMAIDPVGKCLLFIMVCKLFIFPIKYFTWFVLRLSFYRLWPFFLLVIKYVHVWFFLISYWHYLDGFPVSVLFLNAFFYFICYLKGVIHAFIVICCCSRYQQVD